MVTGIRTVTAFQNRSDSCDSLLPTFGLSCIQLPSRLGSWKQNGEFGVFVAGQCRTTETSKYRKLRSVDFILPGNMVSLYTHALSSNTCGIPASCCGNSCRPHIPDMGKKSFYSLEASSTCMCGRYKSHLYLC